ncbi:hypothetical protein GPECTOR_54g238 [Gonium pectorale]|uniref:Starch synthase catalytic domain-containing protein n=1 Tax=Gonium pectorale TaxID=33097 RepID=A0A150G6K0_GONPE|nr:hypothetical protein GPECTOR_54g238 [Gonium pectorale]|eukprot:KXZ45496.1 hypothetical protein GPECTOR_54g238 [Gonium pectorale]
METEEVAKPAEVREPAPSTSAEQPMGRVTVFSPVKASRTAKDKLGSDVVLTPVRRSARTSYKPVTPVSALLETTHDQNVHGTSGAVTVETPGLKRATELRNMVFVTSEVAPWSKTGGLADVLGSLPFALAERGHRVMVVAPRYAKYEGAVDTGARVTLLGHAELVCLGSGNKDLEDGLRWLEGEFRDRARGWVGFNVPLSHRLTAAADILLMPSRFEPCGLNQLYAMRYGAVPVAHKTGGLRDTVTDFDPWAQSGTGWTYTSCDAQGLLHATGLALLTYHNHKEDFRKLQLRGMAREASWDQAAQQYEQIISWALMDPPYCR